MLPFDANRVRDNAREATTEDLLDRVTVYRTGLEPEALDIIEGELHRRGVGSAAIEAHADRRRGVLSAGDGTALRCSFCHNPAVVRAWGWHWISFRGRRLVPLFPRVFASCDKCRSSLLRCSGR